MKKIIILSTIALAPFCFGQRGGENGGHRKPPPHIMEKFDTDGDGELNETEREAAKAHREEKMQERKEFRESFDADGDGELNETERATFEVAREQKILERFDEDGDGVLNTEEQAKADKAKEHMKRLKEKCDKKGGKKDGKKGPRGGGRGSEA